MGINTNALRCAIYEKDGTVAAFSQKMGWKTSKTGRMLRGEYVPDVEECVGMAEHLELEEKQFIKIFCLNYHQLVKNERS